MPQPSPGNVAIRFAQWADSLPSHIMDRHGFQHKWKGDNTGLGMRRPWPGFSTVWNSSSYLPLVKEYPQY